MSKRQTPKEIRETIGMTQEKFWGRIGITQSGGCRYATGRKIPATVRSLVVIAYGSDSDAIAEFDRLRDYDCEEA